MADDLLTIKLYYDYKSPFAYLAMHPAYALMESHRVRLHYIPHELERPRQLSVAKSRNGRNANGARSATCTSTPAGTRTRAA